MPDRNYWISVVSRSHVQLGVEGGFLQLNYGKKTQLKKLDADDGVVLYSPRTSFPNGDVLQSLTAIGVVVWGEIYQVEMTPDSKPYRLDVIFLECRETPIRPLIAMLSFICNKKLWGTALSFGLIKIPDEDFKLIAKAMGCKTFFENSL